MQPRQEISQFQAQGRHVLVRQFLRQDQLLGVRGGLAAQFRDGSRAFGGDGAHPLDALGQFLHRAARQGQSFLAVAAALALQAQLRLARGVARVQPRRLGARRAQLSESALPLQRRVAQFRLGLQQSSFIGLPGVAQAALELLRQRGQPLDLGAQRLVLARQFCLLYTSPSPRDLSTSRMPSSA